MKIGLLGCLALFVCACGDDGDDGNRSAAGASGSGAQSNGGNGNGGSGAGSSSGSGGSGGMKPMPKPPLPKVNDCDSLPAAGVFEEVTPPEVRARFGEQIANGEKRAGTFAMAVDPANQGTVYVGTTHSGLWKSTNCGADWTEIATGTNAEEVNNGRNWTLAVDWAEPETLYTNSGYFQNGLFKSTDGGVNWTDIWSKESQPELGKAFMYNFANVVAIDPSDNQHLLLTFHELCLDPHPDTCIAESFDGGSSWRLLDGVPEWNGNEGQVIFFMDNSQTWLWGSQNNGFWRTEDGGENWVAIEGMTTSHIQGSQVIRIADGTYYAAGSTGIWRSSDGKPDNWTLIEDTGPVVGGLVTDGTNMYTSNCYFHDFCDKAQYRTSPESDGNTWTEMTTPDAIRVGGNMHYDPGHKLMYSSNLEDGLWRFVVE